MRHALITAGTKGLGFKVTERLLEEGYSLTVSYFRDLERVRMLEKRWEAYLDRLQFVQADITNAKDIKHLVNEAHKRNKRIDALILNAGPYVFERKRLLDYSTDEWYEMIEGNLSSMFHFAKAVVPIMREQKYGRIVTYGFQGANGAPGWIYRSAYAAAKVGLVSLMKTLALEEAENGITVNMVCPGNILGEMKEATIEYSRKFHDANTPIGRSGTGEDIARVVAFLCEQSSDLITGSVIEVTGGVDVINRFR